MFPSFTATTLVLLTGCQPTKVEYISESLPVFELVDVNTTSPSFENTISSDQFAPELISAWYFGHST